MKRSILLMVCAMLLFAGVIPAFANAETPSLRMLLMQGGGKLSYAISDGKVYASALELAALKGCSYVQKSHTFARKDGVIYGAMTEDEVIRSAAGNDLVELGRASQLLGLVFSCGDDGRAVARSVQTAAELEQSVYDVIMNAEYRKYETFIGPYYWIEHAGTETVGGLLNFEWVSTIFKKLTGSYDQAVFNKAFNAVILHSNSYQNAVELYGEAEAAIVRPLTVINWLEDASNEEDGALAKVMRSIGMTDKEISEALHSWGSKFYSAVYSDPVTAELMEMADLYEALDELELDEYAKDIFTLVNYCAAIVNSDELTILGMRSVYGESDNRYMRAGAQRIERIYEDQVTGGIQAGVTDWGVEFINKQVGELASSGVEWLTGDTSWNTAKDAIQTVWGFVDEHITHSSEYVDQVQLNSALMQMQLEAYSKLVSIEPEDAARLREYHAVAVLYLRTLLAIYDNGYFDYEDNKDEVVRHAQNDLSRLLQFSYEQYGETVDNSEFIRTIVNADQTSAGQQSADDDDEVTAASADIAVLEDGRYNVIFPVEHIRLGEDGAYHALACVVDISLVLFSSEEVNSWQVGETCSYLNIPITDLYWDDYGWLVMNGEYGFTPVGNGMYGICYYTSARKALWESTQYQYTATVTIPAETVTRAQGPGAPNTALCVYNLFDDSYEINGFRPIYDALCAENVAFWSACVTVENGICTGLSIPDAYGSFNLSGSEMARIKEFLAGLETEPAETANDASDMWQEHPAALEAYAELLEDAHYMWAPNNSLATHYLLFDENGDGSPELLVFGVDEAYDCAGFEVYTFAEGKVTLSSCSGRNYDYHALGVLGGGVVTLNGQVCEACEQLVKDCIIVGGIEIGSEEDFLRSAYGSGKDDASANADLPQLAIGDYVRFGQDMTWQVVNLKDDVATLFYGGCFQGVFDASLHRETHSISLMRYHTYGSATWEYSDLRQWLNSRETSPSAIDVAFDYSGLQQGMSAMGMSAIIDWSDPTNYAYADQPGFLNADNFSELEYWLLEPTENVSIVPYTQIPGRMVSAAAFENFTADMDSVYSDEIGQTSTVDRMYLLNGREIKEYLLDHGISPFAFTNGRSYPAYWLRDAVYSDLAGYYFYFDSMLTVSGNGAGSQYADQSAYVRPACSINLRFVTGLQGEGTEADPYRLEIDPAVIERELPETGDAAQDDESPATTEDAPAQTDPEVKAAFEAAFTHAATKIDKELCLQSAYASQKSYDQSDIVEFLIGLGFDASSIEQKDYDTDATHSVALTMGRRIVQDAQGGSIALYALIIRGTDGTLEWVSNFDVGEGQVAVGFKQAATRVMKHFAQYVNHHPPVEGDFDDGKYLVWTCGHSRGAAVANLLAGKYLPQYLSNEHVYAYGFATPYVDKQAERCANIFNFVILGDLIPRMPLKQWGYERYGLTIYYTDDQIGGAELNSNENISQFVNFLGEIVPTQEAYVSRTKEFLQVLKGEAATKEVDLPFMVKGIISTCATAGTIPELLVRLDANEDLEFVANLFSPGLLPDGFVYTTEDFITTYKHIGASHSMDHYLMWIEQMCTEDE